MQVRDMMELQEMDAQVLTLQAVVEELAVLVLWGFVIIMAATVV